MLITGAARQYSADFFVTQPEYAFQYALRWRYKNINRTVYSELKYSDTLLVFLFANI